MLGFRQAGDLHVHEQLGQRVGIVVAGRVEEPAAFVAADADDGMDDEMNGEVAAARSPP